MRKAIVYSLFGYGKERNKDCFDFPSYLRGLAINLRLARRLYPDWEVILETDKSTYDGWKSYFTALPITIEVNEDNTPLTKAMLWRIKPSFHDVSGQWKYDHIICRDLDSPLTYREAQAVQIWINHDKAMHAITDSISHTIPLLGGMIGLRPRYFNERVGCNTWNKFMEHGHNHDFNRKGADQDFLNSFVYPRVAQPGNDSITQHYVLGMPKTFLSDYHNSIEDIDLGLDIELKESNQIAGHIGAAGFYPAPLTKFLNKYFDKFEDLREAEKPYSDIFYWIKENTF